MVYSMLQGIPTRLLLSHHGVPASDYLVTLYDESYGRQTSSTLPTLRSWHSDKLAWVPERSDHPIQGIKNSFHSRWLVVDFNTVRSTFLN